MVLLIGPGAAHAQTADNPKFDYGKHEEIKAPKWTAKAGAGLVFNSGNATSFSVDGNAAAGYNDGRNKIQIDVNGAYARSTVVAIPAGTASITSDSQLQGYKTDLESTKLWLLQIRYDRFFTAFNSAYLLGKVGGNEPAGKQVFAGAQLGYRRQFIKSVHHDFSGDLGLDYQYEHFVANTSDLNIGSLAVNLRYGLKMNDSVAVSFEGNVLMNLNPETVPGYVFTPLAATDPLPPPAPASSNVTPFQDTRLRAVAMLDAKIWKNLGFNFSFTAIYDNVPAPLAPVGTVSIYLPAQKLDTITSAKLTVTFL